MYLELSVQWTCTRTSFLCTVHSPAAWEVGSAYESQVLQLFWFFQNNQWNGVSSEYWDCISAYWPCSLMTDGENFSWKVFVVHGILGWEPWLKYRKTQWYVLKFGDIIVVWRGKGFLLKCVMWTLVFYFIANICLWVVLVQSKTYINRNILLKASVGGGHVGSRHEFNSWYGQRGGDQCGAANEDSLASFCFVSFFNVRIISLM